MFKYMNIQHTFNPNTGEKMDNIPHIGFLTGLFISLMGLALVGADMSVCLSIVIIIVGLLFLFFQTGPASTSTSFKGTRPTVLISSTIVNMDSKSRWRGKSFEEEELGLLLLIIGIVAMAISLMASFLF